MIPQLVWITDPTGFHTYFNQRWTDSTGYTLQDSAGPDMWNHLLHPADQARPGVGTRPGHRRGLQHRDRFKAKDGAYRWFLGRRRPRRGADGAITTWFGTCTDIHEQRLMRDQLQAAYADLEAKVVFRTLELKHEVQALQARLAALRAAALTKKAGPAPAFLWG